MYGYVFLLERTYIVRFINKEQKSACCSGEGQVKCPLEALLYPPAPLLPWGVFSALSYHLSVCMGMHMQVMAATFLHTSKIYWPKNSTGRETYFATGRRKAHRLVEIILLATTAELALQREICYCKGQRANTGKLPSAYITLFSSIFVSLCLVYYWLLNKNILVV